MAKVPKKQIENDITLIPSDYMPVVIGGLKRSFSRGPVVREFLKKNRREEEWFKKDGTKAAKKHVFYTCSHCKKEFNSTQIQVDHIEPVVPLNIPAKHMNIGEFIKRLFVDESGLQLLCKEHHKEKSKKENEIRKEWLTKTKYIVYETINRSTYKKYIGVHKCQDLDDGYIGSGTLLKKAIEKYGTKSFYRSVLYCFDNPEEAYNKEKELVTEEFISKSDTYNIKVGGQGNKVDTYSGHSKRIVCHQTGKIYESIGDAAKDINISDSSISKSLNNPNMPVRNLHFFTIDSYEPNIKVTFPISEALRKVVHLNTRTTYDSIEQASTHLGLNYKSLRNALLLKDENNVYSLHDNYFLYDHEYDPNIKYTIKHKTILCKELKKCFTSCVEAARYIKHKNPAHGGIAIAKSIRLGNKAYKYTWQFVETLETL